MLNKPKSILAFTFVVLACGLQAAKGAYRTAIPNKEDIQAICSHHEKNPKYTFPVKFYVKIAVEEYLRTDYSTNYAKTFASDFTFYYYILKKDFDYSFHKAHEAGLRDQRWDIKTQTTKHIILNTNLNQYSPSLSLSLLAGWVDLGQTSCILCRTFLSRQSADHFSA